MTQMLSAPPQLAPAPSPIRGPFLELDSDAFLRCLNTRACFVRHRLTDHPLLALPRLLELARRLPSKYVRINSGAVAVNATPAEIPGTGLSTDDSFRRIEDTNTRIMLKHIELDPEYRDLLHACLGELEALGHPRHPRHSEPRRLRLHLRTEPDHALPHGPGDQLPAADPRQEDVPRPAGRRPFDPVGGRHRAVLLRPARLACRSRRSGRARPTPFEMAPGDGVHIPVNHPHWVTTDNEVTISFALTTEIGQHAAPRRHLRRQQHAAAARPEADAVRSFAPPRLLQTPGLSPMAGSAQLKSAGGEATRPLIGHSGCPCPGPAPVPAPALSWTVVDDPAEAERCRPAWDDLLRPQRREGADPDARLAADVVVASTGRCKAAGCAWCCSTTQDGWSAWRRCCADRTGIAACCRSAAWNSWRPASARGTASAPII